MADVQTNSVAIENLPEAMKPADGVGSLIDEVGNRYGRLTVLERAGTKRRSATWKVLCDCGVETTATSHALRRGEKKSCGCGWRNRTPCASSLAAEAAG